MAYITSTPTRNDLDSKGLTLVWKKLFIAYFGGLGSSRPTIGQLWPRIQRN